MSQQNSPLRSLPLEKFFNIPPELKNLAGRQYNYKNIFNDSDSHLLTQLKVKENYTLPLLQTSINSANASHYLKKVQPPISVTNPLTDVTKDILRPDYIIKQKDIYPLFYNKSMVQGYKKQQGIFESYAELLYKNQKLLIINEDDQIKVNKRKTHQSSLPLINRSPPSQIVSKQQHKNIQKTKSTQNLDILNEIGKNNPSQLAETQRRKMFLNHDNRLSNLVQHSIDKEIIELEVEDQIQKSMIRVKRTPKANGSKEYLAMPTKIRNRNPKSIRMDDQTDFQVEKSKILKEERYRSKLRRKDYYLNQIEGNEDEVSDILGKCNDIDENDQENMIGQLSNFDKKIKELHEFSQQDEVRIKKHKKLLKLKKFQQGC